MHALMDDSKLRIIQSYEQGLAPTGSDKQGLTVIALPVYRYNEDKLETNTDNTVFTIVFDEVNSFQV